jgi:hypothetical protein
LDFLITAKISNLRLIVAVAISALGLIFIFYASAVYIYFFSAGYFLRNAPHANTNIPAINALFWC